MTSLRPRVLNRVRAARSTPLLRLDASHLGCDSQSGATAGTRRVVELSPLRWASILTSHWHGDRPTPTGHCLVLPLLRESIPRRDNAWTRGQLRLHRAVVQILRARVRQGGRARRRRRAPRNGKPASSGRRKKSDPLHARHLRDARIHTRDLPHRPQQLSSDHGRTIKPGVPYLAACPSRWLVVVSPREQAP